MNNIIVFQRRKNGKRRGKRESKERRKRRKTGRGRRRERRGRKSKGKERIYDTWRSMQQDSTNVLHP